MMKFKVKRPHVGDRMYDIGETREADKTDVQHLIDAGVLEVAENKADAPAVENKRKKAD